MWIHMSKCLCVCLWGVVHMSTQRWILFRGQETMLCIVPQVPSTMCFETGTALAWKSGQVS